MNAALTYQVTFCASYLNPRTEFLAFALTAGTLAEVDAAIDYAEPYSARKWLPALRARRRELSPPLWFDI